MPFASSSFCCPNNIQPTATIDIALSRISSSFTLRRRRKRREKFVRLQLYLNVFIKFFPSLRLVFWSSLILCLMHIFVEYLLEAGRPKAFWFVMESFVFGCFFDFAVSSARSIAGASRRRESFQSLLDQLRGWMREEQNSLKCVAGT